MGKLALVFPGQGSQTVGMGAELSAAFAAAASLYRRAAGVVGWDVADLSFRGPEERLSQTEFAQVALYVNSAAVAAVLAERGVSGDAVLGHSLGEYSALAAAGVISFEEGLELVSRRGSAMAAAAARRPGSMAAVLGLADEEVERICAESGAVWPVNYNCPGQLVISGEAGAVQQAMDKAREAGARKVVKLPVSGAFHTPLMQSAAEEMEQRLAGVKFSAATPGFFSSISCRNEPADGMAGLLAGQIVSPVRWRQAVEALVAGGFDRFLEVGNGKVLCGLIRRIDKGVTAVNASGPKSLDKAMEILSEGNLKNE
ncbi:MAG: ACP S-malonyltransferase [Actinobacteria bacterium]|nr:ACP S-malonyltransferase [Actinomycetota bacterium]